MAKKAIDAARIRVAPVSVERGDGECTVRVSAECTGPQSWSETIAYRYCGPGVEQIEPSGDIALATFLLPAMRAGGRLEIESPVSPQLLEALPRIQSLYDSWNRRFHTVAVSAPTDSTTRQGSGVGLYFSGGVDAFYSLLTTDEPLTHLVFIAGFEFMVECTRRKEDAIASARAVAMTRDLPLIVVETDFRSNPITGFHWKYGHGAVLFSVAHGMRGLLGTCLVSSSETPATLLPWGTHPELDPMWSTESVALVRVANEVSRWDKLRMVGADDLARKHLRLCNDELGDAFNCGQCDKCLKAIVALTASGDLASIETLPSLDREAAQRIKLETSESREVMTEAMHAFERAGDTDNAELARRLLARERVLRWKRRAYWARERMRRRQLRL